MKKVLSIFLFLSLPLSMILGQTRVVLNGQYVVLSGGVSTKPMYVVIANPNANAIIYNSGWIISENEFNMLQWNIGTSTGTYAVPFGYSTTEYLPLTLNISTAGTVGSSIGVIKFSTYHTIADQYTGVTSVTGDPSDVTNLNAFILPASPGSTENSYNIVDRFYIIDANTGYSTKPTPGNITFSYIHSSISSEVASPNIFTESHLMAERFNSASSTWSDWFGEGCTDAISGSTATVQTGSVSVANFYRSWTLWDNRTSLPLTISATNISCGGGTGSATVTAYGGITPYTYSWSPSGGTSATATGLSAGTYTVTVTDHTGCSSTIAATINLLALRDSIAFFANTCVGSSTGTATVGVKYGTSPYTYLWNPGGQTNATATGLSVGTYSVTVTDHGGCTASASAVISNDSIKASISSSSYNICPGQCATLTTNITGGTSPFTYSWSPGGGTSSTFYVCPTSRTTYNVTVTDHLGCSAVASIIAIITFSINHCIVFH